MAVAAGSADDVPALAEALCAAFANELRRYPGTVADLARSGHGELALLAQTRGGRVTDAVLRPSVTTTRAEWERVPPAPRRG